MSFRLIIRPDAESDLVETHGWYEQRRPGWGSAFLARVDEVFARLRKSPKIHAALYRGVRRTYLRQFPYLVYFQVADEIVSIVAVLHGRRASKVWKSRV